MVKIGIKKSKRQIFKDGGVVKTRIVYAIIT
jgi:hypothetical protein